MSDVVVKVVDIAQYVMGGEGCIIACSCDGSGVGVAASGTLVNISVFNTMCSVGGCFFDPMVSSFRRQQEVIQSVEISSNALRLRLKTRKRLLVANN